MADDYVWSGGNAGGGHPGRPMGLVQTPEFIAEQQATASALAGGVGTPEYNLLQKSERNRVRGQYSEFRKALEKDIHRRGIGRSGFAADAMSKLGGVEGGALADVDAGITDRLSQYQQQQKELGLQMQMARQEKNKNNKRKKIGAGLGIAGLVLAPFTGGASLALVGAGAGMAASG